jgi:hypothetical protein
MPELEVYALETLMDKTRLLAAEYYRTMQQSLPVSAELATYDACRLLGLTRNTTPLRGVDATMGGKKILIKSRVLFKPDQSAARLGQIQQDGLWDSLVLVLFNARYEPDEIYVATRESIFATLNDKPSKRHNRGIMSIARFKAIAELIWTKNSGQLGTV